jgi:hypothetical protein
MRWRKLGRIFAAAGQRPWMRTHTSMPFAEPLDGNRVRVWFTPRDGQNRSHLGWLEIDLSRPDNILALAEEPTLAPGTPGRFDETGAMGSWLTTAADERRHYYIGWSRHATDPFHVAIGLASDGGDGGVRFRPVSSSPILDRSDRDPIFVSTPCVRLDDGVWRMWYLSATGWTGAPPTPRYNIRVATSRDGIGWNPQPGPCIDFAHPDESAIARPCVLRNGGGWRMWYCYRGETHPYRIGYAVSGDGKIWTRNDEISGIDVSSEGWDCEMIAYPYIFDHIGARYMLYAGNGFGLGGMGLAVLEQD